MTDIPGMVINKYPELRNLKDPVRTEFYKIFEQHGDKKIAMVDTIYRLEAMNKRLMEAINSVASTASNPPVMMMDEKSSAKLAEDTAEVKKFKHLFFGLYWRR